MSEICVRLMRKEDMPQVDEIARKVFPEEPSTLSLKRLLRNPSKQCFLVACEEKPEDKAFSQAGSEEPKSEATRWPLSWMKSLFGFDRSPGGKPSLASEHIIGYIGMEMDNSKGHIVDIAVREEYRRQGIGGLLLRSIIEQALQLQADFLTLEVRVSNRPAQALYAKYGFSRVERRPAYYVDKNGQQEDGYYMTTGRITSASYQALLEQLKQAPRRVGARAAIR